MPVINFSDNLLTNPSAEDGVNGWITSGVTTEPGGVDGANRFVLTANAFMYQDLGVLEEPYNFLVAGQFRPDVPWANETHIGAYVIVTLTLLNGKKKIYTFPMRTNDYNLEWHRMAGAIDYYEEGNPVINARFGAKTYNKSGRFDSFSLRKELNSEEGGESAGGLTVTGTLAFERPTSRTISGVNIVDVIITGTLS